MRVLVADDDPAYLEMVTGNQAQWDFEPVTASDGQEALAIMQAPGAPRLLILDWSMPGMDGYELCQTLRRRRGSDEFILIMTGSTRKSEMARILVAGADSYLMKPFDPLDLEIHLRMARRLLALQDDLDQARRSAAGK